MSKPKKKPRRQKEKFVERRAMGLTIADAGMYMLYRVTYLREEGDVHVYFDRIEYGHRVSYYRTPDANDKQVRPDLAPSMRACSLLTEDLKRACIAADRALGLLEGGEKDGARSRR